MSVVETINIMEKNSYGNYEFEVAGHYGQIVVDEKKAVEPVVFVFNEPEIALANANINTGHMANALLDALEDKPEHWFYKVSGDLAPLKEDYQADHTHDNTAVAERTSNLFDRMKESEKTADHSIEKTHSFER